MLSAYRLLDGGVVEEVCEPGVGLEGLGEEPKVLLNYFKGFLHNNA